MSKFIVFKVDRKTVIAFLIAVLIPIALCIAASMLAYSGGYADYAKLPGGLPSVLFAGGWGAVFALMGISSFCIYRATMMQNVRSLDKNLLLYGALLLMLFFWPLLHFNAGMALMSAALLLIALGLAAFLVFRFLRINRAGAVAMALVALWIAYMLYCNIMLLVG